MNRKFIEKTFKIIFLLLIFVLFVVFFFNINPIVIFDTDDWKNINYHRKAIPIWNARNPTRVLPETLMPIVSEIGAYFIYPIMGDFFVSLSLAMATTVSLFITVYVYMLMKLLEKYSVGKFSSMVISIFFVLLHFLVMRKYSSENKYMFYTVDATCYFFYIIPALLNCILVLWLLREDILTHFFKNEIPTYKKSIFCIFLYFCLLSNLFASIILVSFLGADVLCKATNYKKNIIGLFTDNREKMFTIFAWFVVQIFEAGGDRAKDFEGFSSENVEYVIKTIKLFPQQVNILFATICIIIIVFGSMLLWKNKKFNDNIFLSIKVTCISFLACFVYLILLCAKLNGYLMRPDATYGLFFFGVMSMVLFLIPIFRKFQSIQIIAPLVLIIIFCEIDTSGNTFMESTKLRISPKTCIEVDNDIVNQLIEAERMGKSETVLYVPKFETDDNWPIATYATKTIVDALVKYRILSERITICEIIPTNEKNIEFNIQ